jgi:tRNA G46 methylase TrmB
MLHFETVNLDTVLRMVIILGLPRRRKARHQRNRIIRLEPLKIAKNLLATDGQTGDQ